MSSDLYRDIIMQYYRDTTYASVPEHYTHTQEAKNPLCGDDITLYASLEEGKIQGIGYEGKGCSISLAAASMLCTAVEGLVLEKAKELVEAYTEMLEEGAEKVDFPNYPYLEAMRAVKKYPGRLACARLAWETFGKILEEHTSGEAKS